MRRPLELTQEGIAKYRSGYFRICTFQGEYTLIASKEKVSEYIRAPDDVLSMQDAANDVSTASDLSRRHFQLISNVLFVDRLNNSPGPWAMEWPTEHTIRLSFERN